MKDILHFWKSLFGARFAGNRLKVRPLARRVTLEKCDDEAGQNLDSPAYLRRGVAIEADDAMDARIAMERLRNPDRIVPAAQVKLSAFEGNYVDNTGDRR